MYKINIINNILVILVINKCYIIESFLLLEAKYVTLYRVSEICISVSISWSVGK